MTWTLHSALSDWQEKLPAVEEAVLETVLEVVLEAVLEAVL